MPMKARCIVILIALLCNSIYIYSRSFELDTTSILQTIEYFSDKNEHDSVLRSCIESIDILLYEKGDFQSSECIVKRGIQYMEEENSFIMPYAGRLYGMNGYILYQQKKYEEAIVMYQKSLRIFKNDSNYPVKEIICLKSLAYSYIYLNDHKNALKYLHSLLEWSEEYNQFVNPPEIYRMIGEIYLDSYDLQSARLNFQIAFELLCTQSDSTRFAEIYNDLGILYQKMKDNSKSMENYQKALDIAQLDSTNNLKILSRIYNNIGALKEYQKEYQSAIEYYSRALNVEKSVNNNVENTYTILLNIGLCQMYLNNFTGALSYKDQAMNVVIYSNSQQLYMPDVLYHEAIFNRHFGYLQNAFKSVQEAQTLMSAGNKSVEDIVRFNRTMSIPDFLDVTLLKAEIQYELYTDTDSSLFLDKSLNDYNFAFSILDHIRCNLKSEYSKLLLNESFLKKLRFAVDVAYSYGKNNNENYELIYLYAEKLKSSLLAERLSDNKIRNGLIPDDLILQKRKLEKNLNDYLTCLNQQKEKNEAEELEKMTLVKLNVIELQEEMQNLENIIDSVYASENKKSHTLFYTIEDIQSKLDSTSVILNYILTAKGLLCMTITNTDIFCDYTGSADSLEYLITNYYRSIKKFEFEQTEKLSKKLYSLLIQQPVKRIQNKKRILFIPDNYLYHLPFETLKYENEEGVIKYLIEDYTISYHYSASLWCQSTKTRCISENQMTFAGIAPVFNFNAEYADNSTLRGIPTNDTIRSFSSRDIYKLPALPYSESEITEISDFLNSSSITSSVFLKNAAREELFSNTLSEYKIIHIATHGIVDAEIPYLSGLVLYPPDSSDAGSINNSLFSDEDGILYANEIQELELNTELIVLSACESGLGKPINGEGLISLNRGFLSSGVSNVISSLWKVTDVQTKLFMVDFYKNICKYNYDYALALRKTKIEYLNNEKYSNPYYWAGFFITGQ